MAVRELLVFAVMLAMMPVATLGWAADPAPPKGFQRLDERVSAPKTTFLDEHGKRTTVSTFRGRIVILNLWATWCAPCLYEMPSLDRLAALLPPQRYAVIAVSQDKGGLEIIKPYIRRLGLKNLAVFADPNGRLSRDLGVRGLPTTLVFGADGIAIGRLEGSAEWDSGEMKRYLYSLSGR